MHHLVPIPSLDDVECRMGTCTVVFLVVYALSNDITRLSHSLSVDVCVVQPSTGVFVLVQLYSTVRYFCKQTVNLNYSLFDLLTLVLRHFTVIIYGICDSLLLKLRVIG